MTAPVSLVRMPVMVAMPMVVIMVIMVVMAAAATMAVLMLVAVVVVIMPMPMPMVMVMMVAMIVAAVMGDGAVGAEGALHRRHRAAEAANCFGQRAVGQDVERVRLHLGQSMGGAGQQGGAQQPGRVFRPHFQHALAGGPHLHQAAILQLQGVAVIEQRRAGQRQLDGQAAVAAQRALVARLQVAGAMVKRDGVDDAVGFDGGAAGDGGGA